MVEVFRVLGRTLTPKLSVVTTCQPVGESLGVVVELWRPQGAQKEASYPYRNVKGSYKLIF